MAIVSPLLARAAGLTDCESRTVLAVLLLRAEDGGWHGSPFADEGHSMISGHEGASGAGAKELVAVGLGETDPQAAPKGGTQAALRCAQDAAEESLAGTVHRAIPANFG